MYWAIFWFGLLYGSIAGLMGFVFIEETNDLNRLEALRTGQTPKKENPWFFFLISSVGSGLFSVFCVWIISRST